MKLMESVGGVRLHVPTCGPQQDGLWGKETCSFALGIDRSNGIGTVMDMFLANYLDSTFICQDTSGTRTLKECWVYLRKWQIIDSHPRAYLAWVGIQPAANLQTAPQLPHSTQ